MNTTFYNHNHALTLAEVLITIGIIGVTAALTIPTLIANAEKSSILTKVQKDYSILSQVSMSLADENGETLENIFTDDPNLMYTQYLAKYRTTKACSNQIGCFPTGVHYHNIQGVDIWGTPIDSNSTLYKFIIADGTLFFIWDGSSGCNWTEGKLTNLCADVGFDINGNKGPNIAGKDLFEFYINKNGKVFPFGSEGNDCAVSSRYCALRLITEHGINYF